MFQKFYFNLGFTRNNQQGSLGAAGHRMVNHHSGGNNNQGGGGQRSYASYAPPQQYRGELFLKVLLNLCHKQIVI